MKKVETKSEPRGLFGKYRIEKGDGSPVDPKAIYFTLRLDTDKHARAAVRAYIESCREEQPELARDLERVMGELEKNQLADEFAAQTQGEQE